MSRILLAGIFMASLAGHALAFDPQPEPPAQHGQIASQPAQAKAQAKSKQLSDARTLTDYNIQKE